MKVLIAGEESQTICKALRARGHEAYSCDIKPCSGGRPEWHLHCDVLTVLGDSWDLMIAHPDCTRLTNAGVRWLKVPPAKKTLSQMWDELQEGAEFYCKLRDAKHIPKRSLENPIFHCYARDLIKPGYRQIVQPWWFGDKAFKATGFELIGLPDLIPTNKLTPPQKGTQEHKEWSFIHRCPPGPERKTIRSKTFPGIAAAIAEQWAI